MLNYQDSWPPKQTIEEIEQIDLEEKDKEKKNLGKTVKKDKEKKNLGKTVKKDKERENHGKTKKNQLKVFNTQLKKTQSKVKLMPHKQKVTNKKNQPDKTEETEVPISTAEIEEETETTGTIEITEEKTTTLIKTMLLKVDLTLDKSKISLSQDDYLAIQKYIILYIILNKTIKINFIFFINNKKFY